MEDIKSVKVGNEKTLTLSIAIGTGAADYARNYDIAKAAMDLALTRQLSKMVRRYTIMVERVSRWRRIHE